MVTATGDRKLPPVVTNNVLRYLLSPPERLVKRYVSSGERAADLGCGAGFHSLAMARIVGESGRVFAVDFDPAVIARLQRRAERRRCQRIITARATSASEIDFIDDGSIDFVLAEGLLCCMSDHAGAIRQIQRILHPRGRAYLSTVKLMRPDDPRTVTREEWEHLLSSFRLLDRGEALMSRWALVGPREGGAPAVGAFRARLGARGPCCC